MIKKKTIDCNNLKPMDRLACEILSNARRPLSTNEVAEYGNMSWSTAKKHLEKLSNEDIGICRNKRGKTNFWYVEESNE